MYVVGIIFLDWIWVGWWKNGYFCFFLCVFNVLDWSGIYLRLIDEELDLVYWDVEVYRWWFDMCEGIFYCDFWVILFKGYMLEVYVEYINSLVN